MKSNNQSKSQAELIIDIAKLLQDNPILGAGNYPEAARLTANSGRLQRDLQRELEYYHEHPDCDNVRIWHCAHHGKYASYWMSRWGKVLLVNKGNCWKAKDYHTNTCPAMLSRPSYYSIYFFINGRSLRPLVHAIISDLFIPNDDFTKIERDHINGNHLDNNAFNLERVTPEENVRRRYYNYYTRQGRPVPAKFLPP